MTFTHATRTGSLEKPVAPGKWLLFVSGQRVARCWTLVVEARLGVCRLFERVAGFARQAALI